MFKQGYVIIGNTVTMFECLDGKNVSSTIALSKNL